MDSIFILTLGDIIAYGLLAVAVVIWLIFLIVWKIAEIGNSMGKKNMSNWEDKDDD